MIRTILLTGQSSEMDLSLRPKDLQWFEQVEGEDQKKIVDIVGANIIVNAIGPSYAQIIRRTAQGNKSMRAKAISVTMTFEDVEEPEQHTPPGNRGVTDLAKPTDE